MSSVGLAELCHAVQAHEGIEQLKVNLKKEHDLKVDYMTAVWINVCCSHALLHASATHTALHEGTFNAQASVRCCHLQRSSLRDVICMLAHYIIRLSLRPCLPVYSGLPAACGCRVLLQCSGGGRPPLSSPPCRMRRC